MTKISVLWLATSLKHFWIEKMEPSHPQHQSWRILPVLVPSVTRNLQSTSVHPLFQNIFWMFGRTLVQTTGVLLHSLLSLVVTDTRSSRSEFQLMENFLLLTRKKIVLLTRKCPTLHLVYRRGSRSSSSENTRPSRTTRSRQDYLITTEESSAEKVAL